MEEEEDQTGIDRGLAELTLAILPLGILLPRVPVYYLV